MAFSPSVLLALAVAVGVGGVCLNGPSLLRDYQMRNTPLIPALELRVQKAECATHWSVYTQCDIAYAAPGRRSHSLSYSFLGRLPRTDFILMRPVHDRELVVADIGLAHILNRIAGLGAFVSVAMLAAWLAWRRLATS